MVSNYNKLGRFAEKSLIKKLLVMWCDAITRGEGEAFPAEWGLDECVLETSTKKPRCGANDKTEAAKDPAAVTDPPAFPEEGDDDDDRVHDNNYDDEDGDDVAASVIVHESNE